MICASGKGGADMLYIGIDLGTSAVKLLLMDGAGQIKKIVSKEYPIYFPHYVGQLPLTLD